jgi:hypothetical protein
MLRNECVLKVLVFCKRRSTYYDLKLRILKQDFDQLKVNQDVYNEALDHLEEQRFACFLALISIAENILTTVQQKKQST